MSSPYNFGAEPFQGFTEFDESESFDELGEFGEPEFGDLEAFETDFEFEPEEERGGRWIPRGVRGRAPARPIRRARGMGHAGRRPLAARPRRPGVRPPRGIRPGWPRPRPRIPPRPRRTPFPVIFPYPRPVVPQPSEDKGAVEGAPKGTGEGAAGSPIPGGGAGTPAPSNGGTCPTVGRFGNWLRTGNQVTLLLDEDETPIEGGPEAATGAAGPEGAPEPQGAAAPAAGPEGSADTGSPLDASERGGADGELPFAYEFGLAGEFDQERGPITWRGRWSRQGRTIVVHLDEPQFGEVELGEVPLAKTGIGAAGAKAAAKAKQYIAKAKAKAGLPAEKVCWIQNVLNLTQGESLVTDGIYGPKTRAAVTRFQQKNGLKVDGIVGPETTTGLIQAALNQIALASVLPINGVMDAATRQEIIKFQSANNLTVDGIVGRNTRAAMVKALGGRCTFPKPRPGTKPPGPKPGPTPPPPATCDKPELARLVNRCIDDSKRCLKNAHEDLGVALLACLGNPVCNAAEMGKYLLALGRCRDALTLCDQDAKRATKCQ